MTFHRVEFLVDHVVKKSLLVAPGSLHGRGSLQDRSMVFRRARWRGGREQLEISETCWQDLSLN